MVHSPRPGSKGLVFSSCQHDLSVMKNHPFLVQDDLSNIYIYNVRCIYIYIPNGHVYNV